MKLPNKLDFPWRITFDTNPDLCNLNCIMCDTHSIYNKNRNDIIKRNRIMPIQTIEKVLKSASSGVKEIIPSTMGEPLLYPYFEDILALVNKYNIKINLTTNGTFPKLGVEKWGELILPLASDVKISINGATQETDESIMRGINFKEHLENIKRFIEIRNKVRKKGNNYPTVTFQVTYMEQNLLELPKLLRLAIELDVDRFKGHHVWVTWPEIQKESLKRNTNRIKEWNKIVDTLYEIKDSMGSDIKLDNVYKLSSDSDNVIPDSWVCPFLGREAWIAWDGVFNVCCAPNTLREKFGYFGNVNNNDLMELWNGEDYNNLINNWGINPICKKCNMRRPIKEVYGYDCKS